MFVNQMTLKNFAGRPGTAETFEPTLDMGNVALCSIDLNIAEQVRK